MDTKVRRNDDGTRTLVLELDMGTFANNDDLIQAQNNMLASAPQAVVVAAAELVDRMDGGPDELLEAGQRIITVAYEYAAGAARDAEDGGNLDRINDALASASRALQDDPGLVEIPPLDDPGKWEI